MTLVFDGILTLTYNATTLILPTSTNITTAAGDTAVFRGDGSGNVRCISYVRRTGAPLTFGVTHANGGVIYSTASALAVSAVGSSGQILRSGGAGAPTWSTATYPSTAGTNGKVLQSDGTNFGSSTATYPSTVSGAGKIIRASGGDAFATSTATYPDTVTSAGQIMRADGSNSFAASTMTYPDTITSTYVPFATATNALGATDELTLTGTGSNLTFKVKAASTYSAAAKVESDRAAYTDVVAGGGYGVYSAWTTGTANWCLGHSSAVGSYGFWWAGTPSTVGSAIWAFDSSSNIYFPQAGTTASAANAYLDNGNQNKLLRSTSSLRYKRDVEPVDTARIDAVLQLEPIWYRSKCSGDRQDWSWYGFGAEDVAKIDPRLVHWTKDENGELIPDGVQYERVSVLLLGVVKNQQKEIQSLKDEVAAIKAKLGM